jgi:L-ascorbate metabolism protein UlaG (beta-lactamase superfamily)
VSAYHDKTQGKERGPITVFVLEGEGIRLVHLSDLGHQLDDAQAKAIGRPDVLMIPVGGHYTIDAAEAHSVVECLRPGIVIPMHYKTEVNPGSPISPVDVFLASAKSVKHAGHTIAVEKAAVPKETETWVMSWK